MKLNKFSSILHKRALYFSGSTYCIHRCEWTHYPVKSGVIMLLKIHFLYCLSSSALIYHGRFFFQFSVTEHLRGADIGRLQSLPGVFFFYDLSPIKVGIFMPVMQGQELMHQQC